MDQGEPDNHAPPAGPPARGPLPGADLPLPPGGGGAAFPPGPPPVPAADRIHAAWWSRGQTDYIFDYWTALGWTILTLGIYGLYVFYQLVRRMRDHNARRVELFDATLAFAWEEAGRRGLQPELTPSFQRAEAHMGVLRRMTGDFRDPVVWVVLSIIARGVVEIIAFVLLDGDLVKHDRSEVGVEYELAVIFGRFGHALPVPDQARVKGPRQLRRADRGHRLLVGDLPPVVVLQPDGRPNRHFQADSAGHPGGGGPRHALSARSPPRHDAAPFAARGPDAVRHAPTRNDRSPTARHPTSVPGPPSS